MKSHEAAGPPGEMRATGDNAGGARLSRWQRVRLVVKVVELRLRFVAIMAATGFVFAYWDTLWNRYEKWMRPTAEIHAASTHGIEFFCPMHPQVVQSEAGSCPICGMPLAKRKQGEKEILPEGVTARVKLAPFRVEQGGIATASVSYAPLTRSLTTVGLVAVDERRLAKIVSKIPGKSRIEKLHVNFRGQEVEAGKPLAELYSPELSQAIQELIASARRTTVPSAGFPSESARIRHEEREEMLRASVEKLTRWGIARSQIDEILKSRKTDFTVPILSPSSGRVLSKNVVEGQEVGEGFSMFDVADLRAVWVKAQVYEHQLGLIREGDTIEATVDAFPGKTFPGKVEFIQPFLDPSTRTVEVRFALENPGLRLRPDMFATVTLKASLTDLPEYQASLAARKNRPKPGQGSTTLTVAEQEKCLVTNLKLGSMGAPIKVEVEGRQVWACCESCSPKLKAQPARYLPRLAPAPQDEILSIPESAVIDTGTRKIVYVEADPGVFEGREVVLGPRTGGQFPVLEGLAVGERVATTGAFLIDAESRINPGVEKPKPAEAPPSQADGHPHRSAAIPAAASEAVLRR